MMPAGKGYDSDTICDGLKPRGIRAVKPARPDRTAEIRWKKRDYRQCERIERAFGHLKTNRAAATQYDKLARSLIDTLQLVVDRRLLPIVSSARLSVIARVGSLMHCKKREVTDPLSIGCSQNRDRLRRGFDRGLQKTP